MGSWQDLPQEQSSNISSLKKKYFKNVKYPESVRDAFYFIFFKKCSFLKASKQKSLQTLEEPVANCSAKAIQAVFSVAAKNTRKQPMCQLFVVFFLKNPLLMPFLGLFN